MTDPEKRIWLLRVLAVNAALAIIAAYVFIGIGASWATDMWEHRARIATSEQATCKSAGCDQNDLSAQVRAATAAEAMVDISIWQLIIGTVGLAAIGATLWVNARAVGHASRQAEAAEKQLMNADRPHMMLSTVSVGSLKTFPMTRDVPISFLWKNHGRGPCWTLFYSLGIIVVPLDEDPKFSEITMDQSAIAWPIEPGGIWQIQESANLRSDIPQQVLLDTASGKMNFFIALVLCYRDAERVVHTSRTVLKYEVSNDRLVPVADPYVLHT